MVPEQKICENCGKEFRSHKVKEPFCFPCELVIQSTEPPEILIDMRLAYSNKPMVTDGQRRMRQLFEDDVVKFTERLTKLEDQYRSACIKWEAARRQEAAPRKWDGEGKCQGCGRGEGAGPVKDVGTAELIERVEGWMGKQPGGGG